MNDRMASTFAIIVVVASLFLYNCDAVVMEGSVNEIVVPARWKLVLDYDNKNDYPAKRSYKRTEGMIDTKQTTNTVRVRHGFKIGIGVDVKTIPAGTMMEMTGMRAEISGNLNLNYEYSRETETVTMTTAELSQHSEITEEVMVGAHSHLYKWQLEANVVGFDIGFHKVVDSLDPQYIANLTTKVWAKVDIAREIDCYTPLRIKHVEKKRYITITRKNGWPAATLSQADNYFFTLCPNNDKTVTIRTLNTTRPRHDVMYSSDQKRIYFDDVKKSEKQWWFVSRSLPLRDMDIVTFRNVKWPSAFLCSDKEKDASLYCHNHKEEQWMLEIWNEE